jgi:hypothetical protein
MLWNKIKKLFNDILTDDSCINYDEARVYLFLAMFVFFGATIYGIYKGNPFDMQAYGIAFGAMLAGAGVGINFKNKKGE